MLVKVLISVSLKVRQQLNNNKYVTILIITICISIYPASLHPSNLENDVLNSVLLYFHSIHLIYIFCPLHRVISPYADTLSRNLFILYTIFCCFQYAACD